MTERDEQQNIEEDTVSREAFNQAADLIVIYRQTLREMLFQIGIPNNPGWRDIEIFEPIAKKLGVKNPYEAVYSRIRPQDNIKNLSQKLA